MEAEKKKSPVVFCYSLFYVYYDQYTYITGVLAQDVLLGLVFIFVAIQVSNLFFFDLSNLLIFVLDPLKHSNICIYHCVRLPGLL